VVNYLRRRITVKTVTSKDGTTIAYDQTGSGPTIIFVDGALQYRAFEQGMALLAECLAPDFTVIHYDRRGRGDSGDTLPYALEREIEDIDALIEEVGGSAFLYGISSGGALALEAAARLGNKVRKLAIYEVPYLPDDAESQQRWKEYTTQLDEVLAAGRPGDAVGLFMMLVGASAGDLDQVRQMPMWPLWEAVGHTLPYDAAALGEYSTVPVGRAAKITAPALVMVGSNTYPFMHETAAALAGLIPNAQRRTLECQTHEVDSEALAPVLAEFFQANES
jgi:pimeloyl-ACP methyl ester carboxylesterase